MEGFARRLDSPYKDYYDILIYDRPLTDKELRDYELDEIKVHELQFGRES